MVVLAPPKSEFNRASWSSHWSNQQSVGGLDESKVIGTRVDFNRIPQAAAKQFSKWSDEGDLAEITELSGTAGRSGNSQRCSKRIHRHRTHRQSGR